MTHRDHAPMSAIQLSLGVGIFMLVMKVYAFYITGSSAIFSDAAESVVHNIAVGFALYSIWLVGKPADRTHPYGHEKISFFSAGFEGSMIVLAALVIIYEAISRWMHGLVLQNLDVGTLFTAAAFLINGVLGFYLIWRGKKHNSIILEANGRHVLTDSWTSLGVIIGLVLCMVTGWLPFDPLCAIMVALNILWSGFNLMRRSVRGLMDEADPKMDQKIRSLLDEETKNHGIRYHNLRHRSVGMTTWAEVHLLFHGNTSLQKAHREATEIEKAVVERMGQHLRLTTHLESIEDHERVHGGVTAHTAE